MLKQLALAMAVGFPKFSLQIPRRSHQFHQAT